MRYYIEAFADYGQVLGNLDGQAALGDMRRPEQSKAWKAIKSNSLRCMPNVTRWHLVNEYGSIHSTHGV